MFHAIRVPNPNIAKQILSDNWQAKPNVTLCQIVQRRYKLHRRAGISAQFKQKQRKVKMREMNCKWLRMSNIS